MPRNAPRADNSFDSSVYMLSEHDFDKIANLDLLKEDEQYRLVRDLENVHDQNAVAVYFGPLKIGYLERGVALIASKLIDNGDVFSVCYITGYKGTHYNPQNDNKKGDGFYRKLLVRITNESGVARAQGRELEKSVQIKYQSLYHNPNLLLNSFDNGLGCLFIIICIVSFVAFRLIISI